MKKTTLLMRPETLQWRCAVAPGRRSAGLEVYRIVPLFLSNVEEDPGESVNLRRRFPGIVDELVDELATLMQKWTAEVKKW